MLSEDEDDYEDEDDDDDDVDDIDVVCRFPACLFFLLRAHK